MKKRVGLLLVPLLVGATGGLTACGGSDAGSSGDSYVLGAALPLSGAGASSGKSYQQGIDACVKWVNENGDLPKPIRVEYADTGGETEKGISAYTKLTTVDDASMVFSAFSSITTALAPLAERNQAPVMNGGALSPSLADQEWVWNDVAFLSLELSASVPYVMEKHPDLTHATLIYQDDVVGQDAVDIVGETWEVDGRTLDTLPVTVNATSFTAQVDKVKAQDPDVIFLVYSGDSQAALIQQLRSAGVDAQIVGASPLQVPSVIELDEADGALFTLQAMDLASSDEITKFFLKEMNMKPGEGAPVNQANYCNGVLMWANAAQQLVDDGEDVDGAAINEKFAEQGSIEAVGGELELLPDHTLKSDISINQIKNGGVTTLATVPVGD